MVIALSSPINQSISMITIFESHTMTTYTYTTDGIEFTGTFHVENDDEGYNPIFTVNSVYAMPCAIDLMLVIDPRVIHEIEAYLLSDYKWNK